MKAKLLLLMLMLVHIQGRLVLHAQEDESRTIILQAPQDEAIRFHAVNTAGEITPLGSLPLEFRLVNFQEAILGDNWLINSPSDLTISPDRQYVAFSAGNPTEQQLFLYKVNGEFVWSAPVPEPVQILWSQDSDGFVLVQTTLFEGAGVMAYYDLATAQLNPIAATLENQLVRQLQWLNKDAVTLLALDDDMALEMLTLDGEMMRLFSAENISEGIRHSICEREWSAYDQILYVDVGCTGSPETVVLEALYTVDLEGNPSLLLEPPAELRNADLYQAYFLISGIEIYAENTYVVVEQYMVEPDKLNEKNTFIWQVLRLREGQMSEIYSATHTGLASIENPQISPDGRYLTVGLYDWINGSDILSKLLVIDLETGTLLREIDGAGNYGWSVDWLNHYSFLYSDTYGLEACHCAYARPGSRTLLVDLSKFTVLDLSDRLTGSTWLFSNS